MSVRQIHRREFLSQSARLGAAGVAASALGRLTGFDALAAEAKSPWQLGCYTRCFDQFDYRTALDAIAEAGFKYVGLMTIKGTAGAMVKADTPAEQVQGMREEAKQRGLKILSVYGEFPLGDTVAAGVTGLKRLIDNAALCACPHLMLGGTTDPKLYDRYYQVIAQCCDCAASKSVGLSIKPHGGQNATGPQCRKAIETVNHPTFRLWYDPGNIFYYSDGSLDPVADAATVDGLVVGMSVKDFRPPKEVLVNIGAGKVDFAGVLARLQKGGFTHGPLIVECLERGTLDSVKAAAKQARKFLEKLTGGKAG